MSANCNGPWPATLVPASAAMVAVARPWRIYTVAVIADRDRPDWCATARGLPSFGHHAAEVRSTVEAHPRMQQGRPAGAPDAAQGTVS